MSMGGIVKGVSSLALAGFCVAGPALAQPADPTSKAILDALQGLNSRLDSMQRDIDGLKGQRGQGAQPSMAPSPAAASPPSQAPVQRARGELRPGWVVNVFNNPGVERIDYGTDAVGVFIHVSSRFTLQAHQKTVPTNNNVAYKADGFIRIKYPGRYVFYIKNTGQSNTSCVHKLSIDDKKIIDSKYESFNVGNMYQGALDFLEGDYSISYSYGCDSPRDEYSTRNILVRGPDDMTPRDFVANEIVHIARGNQRSSNEAPPANAAPPNTGMIRTVQSEVNVRQQPSTASGIAARLSPGMRIRIAGVTSDQQWAQVQVDGRDVGFIRVSALNLNTQ